MNSMIIYFQLPRTHQAMHEKMTNSYINRDVNGMSYTIGGQKASDKMQQNLMGSTNNS